MGCQVVCTSILFACVHLKTTDLAEYPSDLYKWLQISVYKWTKQCTYLCIICPKYLTGKGGPIFASPLERILGSNAPIIALIPLIQGIFIDQTWSNPYLFFQWGGRWGKLYIDRCISWLLSLVILVCVLFDTKSIYSCWYLFCNMQNKYGSSRYHYQDWS